MQLIDKGSPAKGFKKVLGMTLEDVRFHTTLLDSYRNFVACMEEIERIKSLDISDTEKSRLIAETRDRFKNGS